MKTLMILFAAMVIPYNALAFNIYFSGKPIDKLNDLQKPKELAQLFLAIGSEVLIHEASHWIMLERYDIDYSFSGLTFTYATPDQNTLSKINEAAYVGTAIFGTALNMIPKVKDSSYAYWYNITNVAHTGIVWATNGTDYNNITNADKKFATYTAWSGMNSLFRVEW